MLSSARNSTHNIGSARSAKNSTAPSAMRTPWLVTLGARINMKNSFASLRIAQSTPFSVNRSQAGTVNDNRGAVVCLCVDSGIASKGQRAEFIVEAANISGRLYDSLRIAVSVLEDTGVAVPPYCKATLKEAEYTEKLISEFPPEFPCEVTADSWKAWVVCKSKSMLLGIRRNATHWRPIQ